MLIPLKAMPLKIIKIGNMGNKYLETYGENKKETKNVNKITGINNSEACWYFLSLKTSNSVPINANKEIIVCSLHKKL